MKRYQITIAGTGFAKNHGSTLNLTMFRLRNRLGRLTHGPFHIKLIEPSGNQEVFPNKFTELEARAKTRHALDVRPIGTRIIISGAHYDEPKWALRSHFVKEPPPPESPLITYGAKWIGSSSYGFSATGPPGPSDCSGFTLKCAQEVYNIALPHGANLQMNDERIKTFFDADLLQSGDFIFFNYGRLDWNEADHVEYFVENGKNLGSRPSTNGVSYYYMQSYDYDNVLCYGRLQHERI